MRDSFTTSPAPRVPGDPRRIEAVAQHTREAVRMREVHDVSTHRVDRRCVGSDCAACRFNSEWALAVFKLLPLLLTEAP